MIAAVKDIREIEPAYIEAANVVAMELRHYYEALIDKGFTPVEALQIVCHHGVHLGGMAEK